MAREIQIKMDAVQTFTCSIAGMAASTARQSAIVTNANNRNAALIYIKIQSGGTAPTAGTVYEIYLLRDDGVTNYRTDGAGANDANVNITNAQLLGTIVALNSANAYFYGDFDTAPLGPLGPKWGIAIRNSTDQALNATEANHLKEYAYYVPEIQ